MESKKLAVLTSGGDSPSMNAAIFGFTVAANLEGYKVYAVIDGYKGLINSNFQEIKIADFREKIYLPGTAIGSSRCLEFRDDPSTREKSVENLKREGFKALFVIGGDGSYKGANLIQKLGFPVVVAPGTIDNDVASSHYTIGFFSALQEIVDAVKKIRATSESHSQVTFVEAMGRDCFDLTVAAGLAMMADYVITNKNPKVASELIEIVQDMISRGKKGIVILVTERVYGEKFGYGLPSLPELCAEIEKAVGRQVRSSVLGYIQRGAEPTSWDLYVAQRFGQRAFEHVKSENMGVSIGFNGYDFYSTPISDAVTLSKNSSIDVVEFVNSIYKL
ncbi:6-phosphofructokinase [Candidatus Mycoplasma haematobovis]|uniref:6-phosphofructokinase n=1 Tax=Candidatus Mycoplasma haematobovis TaxID=432608 RepID=A0A1A9QCP2_9MOLU|nr:ATP-dependent 6-phosphofructokinase [Candidatus Mycoplasma haematobovis]OAL10352.1 6-phosphofructokinase [Candidatus Mycoplasma haematobovis]